MSATEHQETLEAIDIMRVMEVLPHRYPFLMVDRIINIRPGEGAVGVKNVTVNEPFFPGHFPAKPVMPGVLIIESMAQTAAAFVSHCENLDVSDKVVFFMSIDKARFRRPVLPGDQMHVHVSISQTRGTVWKFHGEAKVDGAVCADADYAAMLVEV